MQMEMEKKSLGSNTYIYQNRLQNKSYKKRNGGTESGKLKLEIRLKKKVKTCFTEIGNYLTC